MKRISTLLFACVGFVITAFAQTPFQADSLRFVEELQQNKIPQLIEVRTEAGVPIYASPTDTKPTCVRADGMPLFLLGDEGGYWACCYLGRMGYVRKSAAENTAAIQRAYDGVSRHFRYLLAYNAVVQGLQLALEFTEQAQTALGDNSIKDEPMIRAFLESKHRELPDAMPYLDKIDPKACFGE